MGNCFKVIPTPPYREKNLKDGYDRDIFVFDSCCMYKKNDLTYACGMANKVISLPFVGKVFNDLNGKSEDKKIAICYDMNWKVVDYILPNTMVVLCIEDLNEIAATYGFTLFNKEEYLQNC